MSLLQDRPSDGAIGAPVPASPARRPFRGLAALRELVLVAVLWTGYTLGRLVADGHPAAAYANADRVWDLERALHLPDELAVQRLLLHDQTLVSAANSYYAFVHFPATAAFLIWLFLRRPDHYRRARTALAALTAAALVVHLLCPLAPPRMIATTGLVDTGQLYGPTVYGSPDTDTLANQYAAMPSLHVGWAILVAVTLIAATRSRWRWLWLAHPAITLAVVVGTANHYWVDGIVAAAILGAVLLAMRAPARSPQPAPLST